MKRARTLFLLLVVSLVNSQQVTVTITYKGGDAPCNETACEANATYYPTYVCSGDSRWADGLNSFPDLVPPGNIISDISVEMFGRFYCNNQNQPATFFLLVDSDFISYGSFPTNHSGCRCPNCAASFFPVMTFSTAIASGYKYGGNNTFQVLMTHNSNNSICLSSVELTLQYQPISASFTSVSPLAGPTSGGTHVQIIGTGFIQSLHSFCRFGPNGTPVPVVFIDPVTLNCTSSPGSGNLSVFLTFDGSTWIDTGFSFSYHHDDNSVRTLGWAFIGGSLSLLIIGAMVMFVIKRYHDRAYLNGDGDESASLLGGVNTRDFKPTDYRELILMERIGRGNYGEVFKASWRGTIVALKKAKLEKSDEKNKEFLEDLIKEASIMRALRHPNVLQFLGMCENSPEICIITEYMPRGSLYRILHDRKLSIDFPLMKRICLDVAKGMNYLHKEGVIHRDLKSHNLLVAEHWTVKVCDFGLSRMFQNTATTHAMTACGTPCWTAPEVLRNEKYGEKADVYSYGVVLWELITREDPFAGMPPFQVVFAVATQGLRPTIPQTCPNNFARLVTQCWSENQNDRPDFGEILEALEDLDLFVQTALQQDLGD